MLPAVVSHLSSLAIIATKAPISKAAMHYSCTTSCHLAITMAPSWLSKSLSGEGTPALPPRSSRSAMTMPCAVAGCADGLHRGPQSRPKRRIWASARLKRMRCWACWPSRRCCRPSGSSSPAWAATGLPRRPVWAAWCPDASVVWCRCIWTPSGTSFGVKTLTHGHLVHTAWAAPVIESPGGLVWPARSPDIGVVLSRCTWPPADELSLGVKRSQQGCSRNGVLWPTRQASSCGGAISRSSAVGMRACGASKCTTASLLQQPCPVLFWPGLDCPQLEVPADDPARAPDLSVTPATPGDPAVQLRLLRHPRSQQGQGHRHRPPSPFCWASAGTG